MIGYGSSLVGNEDVINLRAFSRKKIKAVPRGLSLTGKAALHEKKSQASTDDIRAQARFPTKLKENNENFISDEVFLK